MQWCWCAFSGAFEGTFARVTFTAASAAKANPTTSICFGRSVTADRALVYAATVIPCFPFECVAFGRLRFVVCIDLAEITQPSVEIEIGWDTVFAPDRNPGAERLDVAKALCSNMSALVLKPLLSAMGAVVCKAGAPGPGNPVQAAFAENIGR
jgi:hypothetical protein